MTNYLQEEKNRSDEAVRNRPIPYVPAAQIIQKQFSASSEEGLGEDPVIRTLMTDRKSRVQGSEQPQNYTVGERSEQPQTYTVPEITDPTSNTEVGTGIEQKYSNTRCVCAGIPPHRLRRPPRTCLVSGMMV